MKIKNLIFTFYSESFLNKLMKLKGNKAEDKQERVLRGCITGMLVLVAVSILFMPYSGSRVLNGETHYMYYTGILFWASLVTAYVLFVILARRNRGKKKEKARKLPAVFCFFKNTRAKPYDWMLLVSAAGFALCAAAGMLSRYISCIMLAMLVFAFHMHILYNCNFADSNGKEK